MRHTSRTVDRPTVVAAAVAILLVVGGLLVVTSSGEPKPLDPTTPEGVVQRYAAAVLDGDYVTALELSTRDAGTCHGADAPAERRRVVLRDTSVRGDTATVTVRIVTGEGPFGSEWESEERIVLVTEDGMWLVDIAPWQLSVCR
jgi:hypothetical protein